MMAKESFFILLCLLCITACTDSKAPTFIRDLPHVQADTLRIAITPGKLSIDQHRKFIRGLEYAILTSYAEGTGVTCTFLETSSKDSALTLVANGHADIASGLFSPESIDDQRLTVSSPYNSSSAALVTQRPDPWYGPYWGHRGYPAAIEQDRNHMDSIWQSSHQTMTIPLDSTRGTLVTSPLSPEALIKLVAVGEYPSVLVSQIVANTYARDFPNLDLKNQLNHKVDLVFVSRSNSPQLNASINTWLANSENWAQIDALTVAYTDPNTNRSRKAFSHPHHEGKGTISAFDADFKAAGDTTGWDWRFLAALAFKESRFDTTALSSKGALGLMQLVPSTALAMEIDSTLGEHGAILAAAKYLSSLDRMFRRSVPDKEERLGFILASYNAGPGHVFDAQRLAKKMNLDPSRWKENVERTLLLLAHAEYHQRPYIKAGYCKGHSVFLFVREVLHYWEHYKAL